MAAAKKQKRKKNKKVGQTRERLKTSLGLFYRFTKKVWPVTLILCLGLGTWYWLLHSDRFGLKNVMVSPCKHVDMKRLYAFIDLREGTNLFSIDLELLQERLGTIPWVKDVCIIRRLPDTVRIKIEEYEPYAVINLTKLYYVDENGFLFKRIESGDSKDYPVLSGFTPNDFRKTESSVGQGFKQLKKAAQLIKKATQHPSMAIEQISEVRFDPLGGFTLVLEPKGTEVRLGKDNYEKKLARLDSIRSNLGVRADMLTLVDLENPDKAVIKGLRKESAG